jgi:hypothetical protein
MTFMPSEGRVLWGPLSEAGLPLSLTVSLCDLRPRFIQKCMIGKGYRAIARNGRVLLASDCPLVELADRTVCLRVQTWHKAILPDDRPAPYGLLLCVRCKDQGRADYVARLVSNSEEPFDLALAVGGGLILEIRRQGAANS